MAEDTERKENKCSCPYCEEEISKAELPFCKPCGVTLRYCVRCGMVMERDAEVCPRCGGKPEWR